MSSPLPSVSNQSPKIMKETAEVATQKMDEDQQIAELREEIEKEEVTFDAFSKIGGKRWPTGTYKKVVEEGGDYFNMAPGYDLAWWAEENMDMDANAPRALIEAYTRKGELLSQEAKIGGVAYAKHTLEHTDKNGRMKIQSKYIYCMINTRKGGDEEGRQAFENIVKLKELTENHNSKKMAVFAPARTGWIQIKKALEFVFKDKDIEIALYPPRGKIEEIGGLYGEDLKGKSNPMNRKRANNAILVKAEGQTYAELLKKIKTEVDIKKSGAEVVAVRKAQSGELLLEIKGRDGATDLLRTEIKDKVTGSKIRTSSKVSEKMITIRGIDAVTTKEEVVEALKNAFSLKDDEIKLGNMRTAYGESQTVNVSLPLQAAERAIQAERIRVGWVNCGIREYVRVVRCFRCWEIGHTKEKCTGPLQEMRGEWSQSQRLHT